jgi:TonB family protein
MKTFPLLSVCLAVGLAVSARAQMPQLRPEHVGLQIIQTDEAQFPLTLRNSWVMNGEATIAINVDNTGRLVECLVTSYSRKEFADEAVGSLKRWKFEPARLNGEPWPAVQELRFDFSRSGVVVDTTTLDIVSARIEQLTQGRYAYRAFTLRELDRIPIPIEVVSPSAPPLKPGESKRTVVVDFYIDEEGRVRLPSVSRVEAKDEYAANAQAAVKKWRFEPPLVNGHPVLVHTQQQFDFVPTPSP